MKKLIFIFGWITLVFSSCDVAFAQGVVMWDTTLTTQTVWLFRILPDNGSSTFNIDVYDSTGGASVLFALSAADTAAAVGATSHYNRIDGGMSFTYPNRTATKVWVKSLGTAHIRVFIY